MLRALALISLFSLASPVAWGHPSAVNTRRAVSDPEMRAFSHLVEQERANRPLEGMRLVGVQHLLGTTGGLLRAFSHSGMRPEHISVIGKTYSQHEGVIVDLKRDAFAIRAAQSEPGMDHQLAGMKRRDPGGRAKELLGMVEELRNAILTEAPGGKRQRIVVLDDGGELIELIHHNFPELHDRIVAVEQTTRGLNRIKGLALRFPVVSVAGSAAKRLHESPMIGRSIARSTIEKLRELAEQNVHARASTLVIGFGAVGSATAEALRDAPAERGIGKREVSVYDHDPTARAHARTLGYRVFDTLEEALPHGHVVVSTTGSTPLTDEHLDLLPDHAILVNGASSSTEFRPDQGRRLGPYYTLLTPAHKLVQTIGRRQVLIDEAREFDKSQVRSRRNWVFERSTAAGLKRLVVPSQGTVINFDGSVDPIPARYIQLTRGLLYLATLQAARVAEGTTGIIELDADAQARWVDKVDAELRESGESLAAPRF